MIDLTQLTVGDRIGGGSQGSVFLASDPRGVRYTVKLVVLGEKADRDRIFERAARFREDVLHRSLVPVLSYGMVSAAPPELARQLGKLSRDALVVVMPYVEGTSLADLMATSPLGLDETVVVLLGVAKALEKLPEDLIHGDLRPPNVFLRPSGEVMLMDPDLTNLPPDGDDMRALGGITLVLLNAARPDSNAEAIALLRTFATDIAGHGMPHGTKVEAHEATHRLQLIAEALGAPLEQPETLLLKRLKSYAAKPASPVGRPASAGASSERWADLGYWWTEHRLTLRALQILGLGLVLAAIWVGAGRFRARPPAPGPDSGSFGSTPSLPSPAKAGEEKR